MPAIQLARLRNQAGLVRQSYFQPEVFVRQFKLLMEFYADNSHRRGKSGEPTPLIHSYNVPVPVFRQVVQEVSPLVSENPGDALPLIDCLWKEENLECRSLAITLLGTLPADQTEEVLNRVQTWVPLSEVRIVDQLLSHGLAKIRREARPHFLSLVSAWMRSADQREQQTALRALIYPLEDEDFEDLPTLFRILTPAARNITPLIKQDLVLVFKGLARKSPNETAYFLKQNMPFDNIPWLTRQVMKDLPEYLQTKLKKALKNPLPPL
jgi:hypothetical protein